MSAHLCLIALERADRPPELFADLGVRHGCVQRGGGSPDLFGGQQYGGGGEGALDRGPGRALGAQQPGGGVGEVDLCLLAGLVEGGERGAGDAWCVALDGEEADAGGGTGRDEQQIGEVAVGDVRLHAGQPPTPCRLGSVEPNALLVPAAVRLGQREGGHGVAGGDARQVVVSGRFVVAAQEGLGGEGHGGEVRGAEQGAARLLEDDAEFGVAEAGAAVLLGDGEPLEAEFRGHPPPYDPVVAFRAGGQAAHVGLGGVSGEEGADDLAQLVLLLAEAEGEIHGAPSRPRRCRLPGVARVLLIHDTVR